jgi:hypothetical protein
MNRNNQIATTDENLKYLRSNIIEEGLDYQSTSQMAIPRLYRLVK